MSAKKNKLPLSGVHHYHNMSLNPLVMPSDAANNSNNTTTATVIIERIRPVTAIPFPAGPFLIAIAPRISPMIASSNATG